MLNKSTYILFISMLLFGVILSISSNSWFVVWMGMEVNMMSFIPLIMEQKNMMSKESSLTYFMTQTIASMLLIMSVILMMQKTMKMNNINPNEMMLLSALMMKSGVSPFHFWMPSVMEGMNWNNCLMLMTIQKITPLLMMSNVISINLFTLAAMVLSVFIGAVGGLNQTSLRKLMAYSSINNNGWMMASMLMSETIWLIYMLMYTVMTMIMTTTMNMYKNYHINQMVSMNESPLKKFMLMMNMLSISGLPPMMGFMPKWLVIQTTLTLNQTMLMGSMIMMTLITIYYYLRVMFTAMTIVNIEPKWNNKTVNTTKNITMMMSMMSIMGLTLITMTISIH